MKSLVDLTVSLLQDCGRKSDVSVDRDIITIRDRVKDEGDSFLTITLPSYAKSFDKALDLGRAGPELFPSFRKERSGTPSFLKGFLSRVFGPDGLLVGRPDSDCILAIRQICLFCKKVQRACNRKRLAHAVQDYRKCEAELVDVQESVFTTWFRVVARVISQELEISDDLLNEIAAKSGHGPGATQDRLLGNQKWVFRSWHKRLHSVGFTYWMFGRGSISTLTSEDMRAWPELLDPCQEQPVRVVFVHKTPKTPRIIAIEPCVMQFAQQVVAKALRQQIENCCLTRGRVNFRDQSVNQHFAFIGSKYGGYATLDMKEASDRVTGALVELAFKAAPRLSELLFATRTTKARLPDGDILTIKKFASMGSATCFPVEALIFYMSIIASRLVRAGVYPSRAAVYKYSRHVFVYGDDLIVPAYEASTICDDLESRFGLLVNRNKSFWTGKFRESCGEDYYDGKRVTPVYLNRDCPADRTDVSSLLSWVATGNQLSQAGYKQAATLVRDGVEESLGERLPEVPRNSPAIGWHDYSEVVPPERWNAKLQRREFRHWVAFSPRRRDPLSGDPALAKCLRRIKGTPSSYLGQTKASDLNHLERSVTSHAVALKREWVHYTK